MFALVGFLHQKPTFPDPPVVDISPVNITANETDEVMIYCTFEANPDRLRSVRW